MKRYKPNPIPAINPVPEYLVSGRRQELYQDTKEVLQVPWMGVVTMALADYQVFYEALWAAVRPIMLSEEAVTACRSLRSEIETEILKLNPPERSGSLGELGYAPREIENIRDTIEVFSHGNFLYTMMATLSRLALEEGQFPKERDATPFQGRHAPDVDVPFVLMEEHHADEPTQEIYGSVRANLGLPFVNTDYRALARWPSYFRLVWGDLEPMVVTDEYEALVSNLHELFVEEALKLPNPTRKTAQLLRDAATKSASLEEVLVVNQMFQWLLPGLIANVAFFRAQLQ